MPVLQRSNPSMLRQEIAIQHRRYDSCEQIKSSTWYILLSHNATPRCQPAYRSSEDGGPRGLERRLDDGERAVLSARATPVGTME